MGTKTVDRSHLTAK